MFIPADKLTVSINFLVKAVNSKKIKHTNCAQAHAFNLLYQTFHYRHVRALSAYLIKVKIETNSIQFVEAIDVRDVT